MEPAKTRGAAGGDQDGIAHGQFRGGDGPDRAGATHRDLAWQEFQKVADRPAATTNGQPLQYLGDEDEQGDDQCREDPADGGRRADGDRHRQFHRHAARDDVLESLLEDRPAADQKADDADDADRREWLPDAEPHGGRRDRNKGNTCGFLPFEGMVVIMPVFMIVIFMMMVMIVMMRGFRNDRARFSDVGQRAAMGGTLDSHDGKLRSYLR